jgi:hypothetical protein
MKEFIKEVPEDLWEMTELEIIQHQWGKDKKTAPELFSRIRLSLWREYDIKTANQYVSQIKAMDFLKGLMDPGRFYRELEKSPGIVRYLVIESNDSWAKNEEILQLGIDEMREIMQAVPAVNAKTGVPAYELLKLKFEIFKFVTERQRGLLSQKTQTENLNVHVKGNVSDLKRYKSIAEIDEEIARLEKDAKPALVSAKPMVDVLMSMDPIKAERLLAAEEKNEE